jgi:hypothetical protein
MSELPINVCRVETPEGPKDYVTCLSHEHIFQHGLVAEAIIGVLLRPLESGEVITPGTFARNRVFVEFMHSVIARRGPELPGLTAEAKRQGEGLVCVVDQRTPTPQGAVPPEDIVGVFEIKNGQVVPGSYQASPKHMILSANGFFRLGSELQPCLLEELAALIGRLNP